MKGTLVNSSALLLHFLWCTEFSLGAHSSEGRVVISIAHNVDSSLMNKTSYSCSFFCAFCSVLLVFNFYFALAIILFNDFYKSKGIGSLRQCVVSPQPVMRRAIKP